MKVWDANVCLRRTNKTKRKSSVCLCTVSMWRHRAGQVQAYLPPRHVYRCRNRKCPPDPLVMWCVGLWYSLYITHLGMQHKRHVTLECLEWRRLWCHLATWSKVNLCDSQVLNLCAFRTVSIYVFSLNINLVIYRDLKGEKTVSIISPCNLFMSHNFAPVTWCDVTHRKLFIAAWGSVYPVLCSQLMFTTLEDSLVGSHDDLTNIRKDSQPHAFCFLWCCLFT